MTMRLTTISDTPCHLIPYQFPMSGGGIRLAEFPVYSAAVEGLPTALSGLLLASDLQGMDVREPPEASRLVGHTLAEEIYLLLETKEGPKAKDVGVVLAGDLHVDPELAKRGGKGDVREIWHAFRRYFRWVCGVAGNHDRFGSAADLKEFSALEGVHYLDGAVKSVDALSLAGVGGIMGNPRKDFRRGEPDYLRLVQTVLAQRPVLTALHESPAVHEKGYHGSESLRRCLEESPATMVVCGHCHWAHPGCAELSNGTQVVNTDGRAILALRAA